MINPPPKKKDILSKPQAFTLGKPQFVTLPQNWTNVDPARGEA